MNGWTLGVVIGDRNFTAIVTQLLLRSVFNFPEKSPFTQVKGDRFSFITDSNPIPPPSPPEVS
ncbi:hypothetical protein [Laspinema olomoucense]|uniref:hypothetical protein n=1 Tax=Laspinema olomoucense TaxID=3231600 RepID=UPI0021BBA391|nr:hypothetical protein [Laspinema sp. D3a]MCT7988201.1 hypothetical protein [Laspinema sp. D3a]